MDSKAQLAVDTIAKVVRDYIERKGLFKVLYVDKAGIFSGPKRCNFSHEPVIVIDGRQQGLLYSWFRPF